MRYRTIRSCIPFLASAILALCLPAQRAHAQQPVLVGSSLDYEFGVPLSLERGRDAVDWCPCDGRGTSWNHTVRIAGSMLLPRLPWEGTALRVQAGLGVGQGQFRSNPYKTDPVLDPSSGVIVTPTVEFLATTKPVTVALESALEFSLGDHLAFAAGPWLTWRFASDFSLTERLLAPVPLHAGGFDTGERLVTRGDQLGGSRFAGGVLASLIWSVPVAQSAVLRFGFTTRADAGALSLGQNLRALSTGFGIALLLGDADPRPQSLEPALPQLEPQHRIVRASGPPRPVERRLTASVDLFSVGAKGRKMKQAVIQSTRTHYTESSLLHPVVYFERGFAVIPARYVQITADRTAGHAAAHLSRPTSVELMYDILNVVGDRMRSDPEAGLVIRGSSSSDEPPALALARADAVSAYLRSVWRIESSRLKTEAAPAGSAQRTVPGGTQAEARSVELFSAAGSQVTGRFVTEWDVEDYQISPVRLDPSFRADRGIDNWQISIAQGGRELAHFSSASDSMQDHADLNVILRNARQALDPLYVEFSVTDKEGNMTIARDTLTLVASADSVFGGDDLFIAAGRTSQTWIVDGSDLTISKRSESREQIRRIAQYMRDDDHVVIAPLLEGGSGVTIASEQQRRVQAQHAASVLLIERGAARANIQLASGRFTYSSPSDDLPELAWLTSLVAITVERQAESRP